MPHDSFVGGAFGLHDGICSGLTDVRGVVVIRIDPVGRTLVTYNVPRSKGKIRDRDSNKRICDRE